MAGSVYRSGDWLIICDVCSKKIKASEAKHRWDGLIVCSDDWEMRHQQDFVQAQNDKISVEFTRPRPPDVFVELQCNIWTSQGVADQGTADCSQADLDNNLVWDDWIGLYCDFPSQHAIAGEAVAGCAKAGNLTQGHF